MTQKRITDDLHNLLNVLPPAVAKAVVEANNSDNLLEIILDLGRVPVARFVDKEVKLSEIEVTHADIEGVVERIGEFDADNRAGLERTLHRISGIRNRKSHIVGMTCRVGRAVYGTIDIIEDLVESGKSLLILGKPGIGKTTMLREAARILADKKRVVIVDTSNEIGGDGDVPHPAVGQARRMQVRTPSQQHEVMIEAVENHNPEVIVIDEIGRELEAAAARTIAERGVQLIGTAHGRTLDNLLINPTLSDLVGGVESVTLSDEEARRRGTQKTVLERRSPPTFDVLVEIQERDLLVVHPDVAASVDAMLRGYPLEPETRRRDPEGNIHITKPSQSAVKIPQQQGFRRNNGFRTESPLPSAPFTRSSRQPARYPAEEEESGFGKPIPAPVQGQPLKSLRVYPYGVARNRLAQAAKRLGVPVLVVNDDSEADVLITLRTYYRNRQRTVMDAEERGMPVYVLRANTVSQIEQSLAEMFNIFSDLTAEPTDTARIQEQTRQAIESVLNGQSWVDLSPASAGVRRLQHDMAREAELTSHSYGKEPNRRVRIYRE